MMAERDVNPEMAQRYLRALVSLYSQDSDDPRRGSDDPDGPQIHTTSAARAQVSTTDSSSEQEKTLMIAELKAKMAALTSEIMKTKASGPADKKRIRKIEAKLDICQSSLEKLEAQSG
jgi:uncharacterized small protein (DUF1192 family)